MESARQKTWESALPNAKLMARISLSLSVDSAARFLSGSAGIQPTSAMTATNASVQVTTSASSTRRNCQSAKERQLARSGLITDQMVTSLRSAAQCVATS